VNDFQRSENGLKISAHKFTPAPEAVDVAPGMGVINSVWTPGVAPSGEFCPVGIMGVPCRLYIYGSGVGVAPVSGVYPTGVGVAAPGIYPTGVAVGTKAAAVVGVGVRVGVGKGVFVGLGVAVAIGVFVGLGVAVGTDVGVGVDVRGFNVIVASVVIRVNNEESGFTACIPPASRWRVVVWLPVALEVNGIVAS
jgi:hypothetical protein